MHVDNDIFKVTEKMSCASLFQVVVYPGSLASYRRDFYRRGTGNGRLSVEGLCGEHLRPYFPFWFCGANLRD